MADRHAEVRPRRLLRYVFGGALLVMTMVAAQQGLDWHASVIVACAALVVIFGGDRRIFRTGVSRSGNEIVCRYQPWCEGNAWLIVIVVVGIGFSGTLAGSVPGNPLWMRFVGVVLLCVVPILIFGLVRSWRLSLLSITASTLRIRTVAGANSGKLIEIGRERIRSIEAKVLPAAGTLSKQSLHAEIVYEAGVGETVQTVALGPYLSIEPNDLLNALVAWKDGAADDPTELLDRVEEILRGHSVVRG